MDLHASQIQGFFDIPVDNLAGNPIFVDYYAKKYGEGCEDMMVVSPDVGSVARARAFAQKLHMNLAIVDKRRQKANQCEVMNVIGDVRGKDCILFDDLVDTGGSLCHAAKALGYSWQDNWDESVPLFMEKTQEDIAALAPAESWDGELLRQIEAHKGKEQTP